MDPPPDTASDRARGVRPIGSVPSLSHVHTTGIDMSAAAHEINVVEIHDLDLAFGQRTILSGLNMAFPHGKVVAIMGGPGSGKTTILRLISGMLRPQSGRIIIDGELPP